MRELGRAGLAMALAFCGASPISPIPTAWARPTDAQGPYAFAVEDTVEHWDAPGGAIRVHFSTSGPNATRMADANLDDVPDFVAMVGATAADVIATYEALGFRPPLPESEFSLGALGGSTAFDVYLVDFAGNADGLFGIDACQGSPPRCVGYIAMENDFMGYGYESLEIATQVLTSHEIFHAVQAAYISSLPTWMSEGTATWAEQQYAPGVEDFLRFADAYLEDTSRSIHRPPTGPVPAFAYGSALWFDFLTQQISATAVIDLLAAAANVSSATASEPLFELAILQDVLGGADALGAAWRQFATWNLATNERAGELASYAYAAELRGIDDTAQGAAIDATVRFYPLAASYFLIEHAGGPLYVATNAAAPDLWFALHPVVGGSFDGPVAAAIATWNAAEAGQVAVKAGASLPAGTYWLIGAHAAIGTESVHVRLCAGDEPAARACTTSTEEDNSASCAASGADASTFWLLALVAGWSARRRAAHS